MKIRLTGVAGFDGDYEFDLNHLTFGERRTIKQLTGVRTGELLDAFKAGDTDLLVALAVLAIERSGRNIHPDLLWASDTADITVIPDEAPESPGESESGPSDSKPPETDGPKPPSGATSSESSDSSPENSPSFTGHLGSETDAA